MLTMDPTSQKIDPSYWDDHSNHSLKYERNLNFATASNDEDDFGFPKKKTARDPMSHRIIEKRRRDRMNNCLADLSRLIPAAYTKKSRGRIEKTEIIEMAIKHVKHLQGHACRDGDMCAIASDVERNAAITSGEQFGSGFQECLSEVMHFLVDIEGLANSDSLCVRLMNHLKSHYETILKGGRYNSTRTAPRYTNADGYTDSSPCNSNCRAAEDLCEHKERQPTPEWHPPHQTTNGCIQNQDHHAMMSPPHLPAATMSLPSPPRMNSPPPLIRVHQYSPTSHDTEDTQSSCPSHELDLHRSQLREMLQNPQPVSNKSDTFLSPTNCHRDDTCSSSMYKFKNNIKKRFTADMEHATSGIPTKLSRRDSETRSLPSSPSSPHSEHAPEVSRSHTPSDIASPQEVPIFALHPKGTFYIPLTVQYDIVAPYVDAFSKRTPVLHPVTISVSFCEPFHQPVIAVSHTDNGVRSNSNEIAAVPKTCPQQQSNATRVIRGKDYDFDHPTYVC